MDLYGFDDSLFMTDDNNAVNNVTVSNETYKATQCIPHWFESDNAVDQHLNLKYQADYAFYQMDYARAVILYNKVLDVLPNKHISMLTAGGRDIQESIVRCHLFLDQLDEAHTKADLMYVSAQNFEQNTNALRVLQIVHHIRNSIEDEKLILLRLIGLHPLNPQFWFALTKTYQMEGNGRIVDFHSSNYVPMLTCTIRTRLLLAYEQHTAVGFMVDTLQRQTEQIDYFYTKLKPSEDAATLCMAHVSADIPGHVDSDILKGYNSPCDHVTLQKMSDLTDEAVKEQFRAQWYSWNKQEI